MRYIVLTLETDDQTTETLTLHVTRVWWGKRKHKYVVCQAKHPRHMRGAPVLYFVPKDSIHVAGCDA